MKSISTVLPELLPDLRPGRLLVLAAAHAAGELMLGFAAHLAWRGPLRVLDGGNRFNAYLVARALGRQAEKPLLTPATGLAQALQRIHVARAFTCYQMAAMLEKTPADAVPTLALDLLSTFYDESAPLDERRRLAHACMQHLRRLSQHACVVASLRPPRPPQTDPTGLLDIVQAAADQVWFQEVAPPISPLKLL